MAQKNNNLVVVKSDVLSVSKGNVELPEFKSINLGEEPRRLKVAVRKGKTKDGKIFNSISGYVKLPVYDGEDYLGVKVKRLSVHFRKGAFKTSANVTSPEDDEFKSGYLYVKAKGLRIPNVYKVTEEVDKEGNVVYNEDGTAKLRYPEIWVESDVLGLQAFVTSQNALDVDSDDKTVDATVDEETGEVLYDDAEAVADLESEEPETEETTI
jgi:hypothetical protein